jgi:hypothetical protein
MQNNNPPKINNISILIFLFIVVLPMMCVIELFFIQLVQLHPIVTEVFYDIVGLFIIAQLPLIFLAFIPPK